MARAALGVDLGLRTITVAEVRVHKRQPVVTNVAGIDLPYGEPQGVVVEQARALRALLNEAGIRERRVWIGVRDREQVVDHVTLSAPRGRRRAAELRNVAADRVSGSLDRYVFDTYAGPAAKAETSGSEVVLACMPRAVVADAVAVVQRADLRLRGVDLQAFGALRTVGRLFSDGPGTDVIVDLGASATTLLVHRSGVPLGAHVIEGGTDALTDALARTLAVGHDNAAQRLRKVSIGRSSGVPDRVVTESSRRLVAAITHELRRMDATRARPLRDVVVVGGGARIAGLSDLLQQALGVPVRVGSPFDRVRSHRIPPGSESLEAVGPQVATAVGLALNGLR